MEKQQVKTIPTHRVDRLDTDMRPLRVTYDIIKHAAGSVLIEQGDTKVICAVTMQKGVPPFLRGSKTGWLTAEYAMLPAATHERCQRETISCKKSGRGIEISRMIGRAFRSVTKLDSFGEQTIHIDCDVLQADGSTRAAAIIGASLALHKAQEQWLAQKRLVVPIITSDLLALSVGVARERILVDLDYAEDSCIEADFTFITTSEDGLIALQGGTERAPLTWDVYQQVGDVARAALTKLRDQVVLYKHG